MENKNILWGVIAAVVIFGFLTIVYMATSSSSSAPAQVVPETKTIQKTDHVTWSPAKKHILTEYGDFQCPACGAFYQYIKANIENDKTITNNITFVFREFPLTTVHQHALEAAYAAEAAGQQGKFFEMGNLLFDSQASWGESKSVTDTFAGFAKQLKLDMDKYNADLKSKTVKDKINADMDSGNNIGVNSTPTYYLDGVKIDTGSFTSLDQFKQALKEAAKK